jgi:hypothetical protein
VATEVRPRQSLSQIAGFGNYLAVIMYMAGLSFVVNLGHIGKMKQQMAEFFARFKAYGVNVRNLSV